MNIQFDQTQMTDEFQINEFTIIPFKDIQNWEQSK